MYECNASKLLVVTENSTGYTWSISNRVFEQQTTGEGLLLLHQLGLILAYNLTVLLAHTVVPCVPPPSANESSPSRISSADHVHVFYRLPLEPHPPAAALLFLAFLKKEDACGLSLMHTFPTHWAQAKTRLGIIFNIITGRIYKPTSSRPTIA